MAQGFVVLSAADTDAPGTPAVGTCSKDEPGDDGGFGIGAEAAGRGAVWTDRFYWTGNPDPTWVAGRCDDALEAGAAWAQCGNELNLGLEGFQGGPEAYFAFEDAVRSHVVDPSRLLAMPPSPGVPGWEAWVRPQGDHAVHCYGSCDGMRRIVEWYLANTSGEVVVTECNFGAGNQADVEEWAEAELRPFLDWCATQDRVAAVLYFAWVWRGAPPMPTSVDAKGTAVERVVVDWVPPEVPDPPDPPPNGGGTVPEWYPAAVQRPISVNYTPGRGGATVAVLVDHVADGHGSPFGWFNSVQAGASAHFWVSRDGVVEQYRPLSDTAWANGPVCQPDMSNPSVAAIVSSGVDPNRVTCALEHEALSGEALTPAQVDASHRLHEWLGEQYGIPLNRDRVIGHYQLDSCTRAHCPGSTFPWEGVLGTAAPADPIVAVRDQVWALAGQAESLGHVWLGQAWKAATALSKGEA